LGTVDKAAIAWSIAIVAFGVGIAAIGPTFDVGPSEPTMTVPAVQEEPMVEEEPIVTKALSKGEQEKLLLQLSDDLMENAEEFLITSPMRGGPTGDKGGGPSGDKGGGPKIKDSTDTTTDTTADELICLGSDSKTDSDCDGISDGMERKATLGFKTNPKLADTDGDGLGDLREYWWGTDPTDPDTNDDTYLDGESIDDPASRIFPYMTLDPSKDPDGDGIPTAAERYDVFTDPTIYSTDGDRYDDGIEFFGISTKNNYLPAYVPADPLSPATPNIIITVDPNVKLNLGEEIHVPIFSWLYASKINLFCVIY